MSELKDLQIELVKLELAAEARRASVALFEGRDAAARAA